MPGPGLFPGELNRFLDIPKLPLSRLSLFPGGSAWTPQIPTRPSLSPLLQPQTLLILLVVSPVPHSRSSGCFGVHRTAPIGFWGGMGWYPKIHRFPEKNKSTGGHTKILHFHLNPALPDPRQPLRGFWGGPGGTAL